MDFLPPRSHGIKAECPYWYQIMVSTGTHSITTPLPSCVFSFYNVFFLSVSAVVDIQNRVIMRSSGLFTVHSTLYLTVEKEDKDAYFYCEVTYPVPGAEKMLESNRVNITVHCEPFPNDFSDMYYALLMNCSYLVLYQVYQLLWHIYHWIEIHCLGWKSHTNIVCYYWITFSFRFIL